MKRGSYIVKTRLKKSGKSGGVNDASNSRMNVE